MDEQHWHATLQLNNVDTASNLVEPEGAVDTIFNLPALSHPMEHSSELLPGPMPDVSSEHPSTFDQAEQFSTTYPHPQDTSPGFIQPDAGAQQARPLAEIAAEDLFVSMFQDHFRQRGDLHDFYVLQIMQQVREMGPDAVQQFSTRFLERAYSIFQSLQGRVESNSPREGQTRDIHPMINGFPVSGNLIQEESTIQASQLWLDHFPVPEEMQHSPGNTYPDVMALLGPHLSPSLAHGDSEYELLDIGNQFVDPHSTHAPTSSVSVSS